MCAAISRSDTLSPPVAPVHRWADGAAEIGLVHRDGRTRLSHLYQSDPCRVLFPRVDDGGPVEAVIVTTSGGIVGGDRIGISLRAGDRAAATIVTQAAEKIYRSAGATSEISIDIAAVPGAVLEWMPLETILFDRSRLRRSLCIDAAPGARVVAGEITVFGRGAHGERYRQGLFHDDWRVRRGGRLVWADAMHLDGEAGAVLGRATAFGGATACATFVYVGDDAAAALDIARSLMEPINGCCHCAASRMGDVMVGRFLAASPADLREAYRRFWGGFRAATLGLSGTVPRIWEI